MKNWQVTIKQTEEYNLLINAETQDEAEEKAWSLLETREGKADHHHDSDATTECFEEQ